MKTPHLNPLLLGLLYISHPAAWAETSQDAPWDVNHPPGPAYTANINTHTGTWMSVDVSPDGKTILFDLLGDLYTLPITGGKAKPLTSGMAWDMQPRFSPDGKSIAYISDAGGGNNIWIMQTDGSKQRPISRENFRTLNSPAWSPDGRFIAARKHFTSTRSLGAGEIWLYSISADTGSAGAGSGGTGLPLNQRPNDQKDLGEPAFSPDGQYVYFSRDSTSGDTFEYNKNSNAQIYEIFAIDRHTGKIETIISGPGGAASPTPSPDGKYIAFIRRIHNQTALFLKDMTTDEIIPIYSGLERDMQETWAIHGVYPQIAWTPDSQQLVFWARGKIHRLNLKTRAATEIPFQVQDTREMREALHSTRAAAPEKFPVNMLRWPSVAADGKHVVYSALGYLYIKALPDGTPKRLTRQNDHFEFYPAFSQDGRWIVYASWNDQALGQLYKIRRDGSDNTKLTRTPGHYIEPRFSPDGRQIVFRKTRGGYLTSSLYSAKPGIYRILATGGDATLITDSGHSAFFNAASKRIFFARQTRSITHLISVDLAGHAEQIHIATEYARSFHLSPDEKWLAFVKQHRLYLTPYTQSGLTIPLEPDSKNLPVKMLSATGAAYVHWTGTHQLHWTEGSKLFSRAIQAAPVFADDPAENPVPITPIEIGFVQSAEIPQGSIVLKGGRIITMQNAKVIENGVIVIRQNRIAAIGSHTTPIPANAHIIDVSGKTIIPGLIDIHWHGEHGENEIIPQQNWNYYATLAFGVTTLHDPSAETSHVFSSSELTKAGLITAPRVFSTGTILYGAQDIDMATIENLAQAKTHIARMQAVGAFSVKSYNQPRREQRQQILAAARAANMLVVPEGGSLFMNNMTMIVDGHSSIEHSIPMEALYDDVKQLWSQSRTAYTPTLNVAFGGLAGEYYWYHHQDVWKHPLLSRFVPHFVLWPRAIRRQMAPESDYNHFNVARTAKQLSELGVQVQLGAHGQREGLGAHWELWMLTQGGMSPLEALRTATLNNATLLGMDKDLGSLETGKLADLVILDANPLDNIYDSDKISQVMLNGRLYDASTMHQIAPTATKRQPFFFEKYNDIYLPQQ